MKTKKSAAKWKRPVRAIVRFINRHKGREGNPVQVAVLECGHKRAVDMAKRKHLPCNRCLIERRSGKAAKAVKKAA